MTATPMSGSIATNFCQFLNKSPTAFHAVQSATEALLAGGFERLSESEPWHLQKGKKVSF